MFRRFLIVCWALFALCVVTATVGWYFGFEADRQREVAQAEYDALLNEPINFVDEIMAEGKDKSELSEDELKALARSEERRKSETVLAEIDKRVSIWAGAIVYGAFAAILILLWNILWHIGHWIWMGRKTE